jgi:hypothetical protein
MLGPTDAGALDALGSTGGGGGVASGIGRELELGAG